MTTLFDLRGAMESAVAGKDFILGDRFSMADCVFGGTVRYMTRFKMLEPSPALAARCRPWGCPSPQPKQCHMPSSRCRRRDGEVSKWPWAGNGHRTMTDPPERGT